MLIWQSNDGWSSCIIIVISLEGSLNKTTINLYNCFYNNVPWSGVHQHVQKLFLGVARGGAFRKLTPPPPSYLNSLILCEQICGEIFALALKVDSPSQTDSWLRLWFVGLHNSLLGDLSQLLGRQVLFDGGITNIEFRRYGPE